MYVVYCTYSVACNIHTYRSNLARVWMLVLYYRPNYFRWCNYRYYVTSLTRVPIIKKGDAVIATNSAGTGTVATFWHWCLQLLDRVWSQAYPLMVVTAGAYLLPALLMIKSVITPPVTIGIGARSGLYLTWTETIRCRTDNWHSASTRCTVVSVYNCKWRDLRSCCFRLKLTMDLFGRGFLITYITLGIISLILNLSSHSFCSL